jgi:hypothetical protein
MMRGWRGRRKPVRKSADQMHINYESRSEKSWMLIKIHPLPVLASTGTLGKELKATVQCGQKSY